MRLGIDVLLADRRDLLAGKRVGVLAHEASRGAAGEHTIDRLLLGEGWEVTALFGPEHGVRGSAEDMEPVEDAVDPASHIPIHSLYGTTRGSLVPTPEMLEGIDLLVIDLQDVGSRYYTYVWTAVLALEACAKAGTPVIVCDRPNPLGGLAVEGGAVEEGFESFVGLHSVPVRHGMTIGEIVHWMNGRERFGGELTVIPMEGWQRAFNWPETGISWTNPSPNMRSYTAALVYPGMCLLEGTNLSEGRGTETPFEIVGAPYIDLDDFLAAFEALGLPGVTAAPTTFVPTRRKWAGKMCQGVRWVVSDPAAFRPYRTGLAFVWLVAKMYGDAGFAWNHDPYEFVTDRPAIDLLTGSATFRERIAELTLGDLEQMAATPKILADDRAKHLLY